MEVDVEALSRTHLDGRRPIEPTLEDASCDAVELERHPRRGEVSGSQGLIPTAIRLGELEACSHRGQEHGSAEEGEGVVIDLVGEAPRATRLERLEAGDLIGDARPEETLEGDERSVAAGRQSAGRLNPGGARPPGSAPSAPWRCPSRPGARGPRQARAHPSRSPSRAAPGSSCRPEASEQKERTPRAPPRKERLVRARRALGSAKPGLAGRADCTAPASIASAGSAPGARPGAKAAECSGAAVSEGAAPAAESIATTDSGLGSARAAAASIGSMPAVPGVRPDAAASSPGLFIVDDLSARARLSCRGSGRAGSGSADTSRGVPAGQARKASSLGGGGPAGAGSPARRCHQGSVELASSSGSAGGSSRKVLSGRSGSGRASLSPFFIGVTKTSKPTSRRRAAAASARFR